MDRDYAEASKSRNKFEEDGEMIYDVFSGQHYRSLRDKKTVVDKEELFHSFFSGVHDVALGLFFDGFQIFKCGDHEVWPIIAVNCNLPP